MVDGGKLGGMGGEQVGVRVREEGWREGAEKGPLLYSSLFDWQR